jgi:hypothetical protein
VVGEGRLVGTGTFATHLILKQRRMGQRWGRIAIIDLRSSIWMLIHGLRRRQRRVGAVLRWLGHWEGLSVGAIEHHSVRSVTGSNPTSWRSLGVAKMRIRCVGRHEGLSLGGHGCEHALLVEADAVTATPILGGLES